MRGFRFDRRWLVLVGVLVLVVPAVALAAASFDDVPESHTHFDGIEWMKTAGVTLGCDSNSYCPDDPVTRAQMGTFMYRFAKFLGGEDGQVDAADHADHATAADSAADADTLDGISSADLVPGGILPSGVTIRGTWDINLSGAATTYFITTVSYGYSLQSAPTAHYIGPGDTVPAECPGTLENPQADAGHLCVWGAPAVGTTEAPVFFDPSTEIGSFALSNNHGFGLTLSDSGMTGFAFGSWAVTSSGTSQVSSVPTGGPGISGG